MKARENSSGGRGAAGTPALYCALVIVLYVILVACVALLGYMIAPRLHAWSGALARWIFILLPLLGAAGGVYLILEMRSLMLRRDCVPCVPFARRRAVFRGLYPCCRMLGRVFGCTDESVSRSCIAFINLLTRSAAGRAPCGEVLVLLPRCVQNSACPQKLLEDIENCRRCGKCDVGRVVAMRGENRFRVSVVTGGEMARDLVRGLSPSFVIAVACERELLEGVRVVADIPVLALPNRRPQGPCRDTVIDMEALGEALVELGVVT